MWRRCGDGRLVRGRASQKQHETARISQLPLDLILKIASSLSFVDLCTLGSCSRFWREVSRSDCLWVSLSRQRWPRLFDSGSTWGSAQLAPESSCSNSPGKFTWRTFYIKRHEMIASVVCRVATPVAKDPSKPGSYTKSVKLLDDLTSNEQLSFKDAEIFLFNQEISFGLTFLGFAYCTKHLKVSSEQIRDVLIPCVQKLQKGTISPYVLSCQQLIRAIDQNPRVQNTQGR